MANYPPKVPKTKLAVKESLWCEILIFTIICFCLVVPIKIYASSVQTGEDEIKAVETRGNGFSLPSPLPPSAFNPCYLEMISCPEKIKAKISYYTASKDETDDSPCLTADGTFICLAKENIIASNWLTFGSLVNIDGVVYRVADRMAKRFGKPYLDILVSSQKEAIKKGIEKKNISWQCRNCGFIKKGELTPIK